MSRIQKAVSIAGKFLDGTLSPLQAASEMRGVDIVTLSCWEGTGGPEGPLSAFYGAADAADKCHFLGRDVERWHIYAREQKRNELARAEDQWRGPVDHACRTLIEYAVTRE